jgi:O-methyltransferase/methyltransferase family protein
MTDEVRHTPPSAADAAMLRQLIMGFRSSQMIYVAAKLAIADRLEGRPQTADELASAVGAEPRALYRLMRALASIGIFAETEEKRFELTPVGRLLQSSAAGSLRSTALVYGDDVFWSTYGRMLHSVQTGRPAFDQCHGEPLFRYLETHPATAALFHDAMSGFSEQETSAILAAYDFSDFAHVVDVGGGHGALVAALLGAHAHLRAVVFDLELAARGAQELLSEAGLAGRTTVTAGDFFRAIPAGGDLYLLKSVLHNWDDAAAVNILRNCRAAMAGHAKLLVIERVIPAAPGPSEAILFDINMLVVLGGQERTQQEYAELFRAADLVLTRVIATRSPMSLVEGVPAR